MTQISPEPQSAAVPIDTREFRNALGQFTTGVCLVTLMDDAGVAHALTVNSFASVSLDPPLVLWSLQKDSEVYSLFAEAQRFAIGVLSATQESHSSTYAQKGMHHMDVAHYAIGENGAPVVHGALANFECSLERAIDGGDHTILLGRVTRMQQGESAEPLVFQGGAYRLLR